MKNYDQDALRRLRHLPKEKGEAWLEAHSHLPIAELDWQYRLSESDHEFLSECGIESTAPLAVQNSPMFTNDEQAEGLNKNPLALPRDCTEHEVFWLGLVVVSGLGLVFVINHFLP